MSVKNGQQLLNQLKTAFQKGDLQKSATLLKQLKLALIEFESLPPSTQLSKTAQQELTIARDCFEIGVLLSVQQKDEKAFERNFVQLKTYYTDVKNMIGVSPQQQLIEGLNLLRLLVENRISEFHIELELIPASELKSDYLKIPIELEQSLMEGAYSRILTMSQKPPHTSFQYFIDQLTETVRSEIASCCENAYDELSIQTAKKLLKFKSDQEVKTFASENGWQVAGDKISFNKDMDIDGAGSFPTNKIIENSLMYARELERII
eukprot:TRINITY_DN740_c0_g1_i1.p1 TRINITY_DN740_c0_g1~~TRINITY_DN740_c0_g1_i1.p1  ORF type:complete len:309 (-),score=47.02 TRINITY_DN740_c0_g1_i1:128-919(-)